MKKYSYLFTLLFFTPFILIAKGKKEKVLTLTNGQYEEFFDSDSIEQIGLALYNVNSKKIVGFAEEADEEIDASVDDALISRWLSLDPLASKYTSMSPYVFVGNSPILLIDPDGRTLLLYFANKADLQHTINSLAIIYATQSGQNQIDNIHSKTAVNYSMNKGSWFSSSTYNSQKNKMTIVPSDPVDIAHELAHADEDERGRYCGVGTSEGMAVKNENYLRSVYGNTDFRTEYSFGIMDNILWSASEDFENCKNEIANPNPEGEKITVTGASLPSIEIKSDDKNTYTFDIQKVDASSINKSKIESKSTVLYYDYKKNKDSKVEKKAIVITPQTVNN